MPAPHLVGLWVSSRGGERRRSVGGLVKNDVTDFGFQWFALAMMFKMDLREANMEAGNTNDPES